MYTISNCYSDSFVHEVVSRVRSGEFSAHKARQIYGIGGKMTVYRWLERCNYQAKEGSRYKMANKKKLLKEPNRDLELESAQLRLEYYETIFSLAKEEYGVDFKKILGSRSKAFVKDEEDSKAVPDSV